MNTNPNLQAALDALVAERQALDQKANRLDAAIASLCELLGIAVAAPPASNGASARRPRRSKDQAVDKTSDAILACLRQHGPLSPADLKKRAKISDYLLNSRLKQLGSRVVVTGTTNDRMIALPGKTPAKEAQS